MKDSEYDRLRQSVLLLRLSRILSSDEENTLLTRIDETRQTELATEEPFRQEPVK